MLLQENNSLWNGNHNLALPRATTHHPVIDYFPSLVLHFAILYRGTKTFQKSLEIKIFCGRLCLSPNNSGRMHIYRGFTG